MRKERQLIPDILDGSKKNQEKNSKAETVSKGIVSKLGEFITRHGGWDKEACEPINLGNFPMFDGEENTDTWDNFYDVEVNFTASNENSRIPDGIKIKIHKEGEKFEMRDFLTITSDTSYGSDRYGSDGTSYQIFDIRDNLGHVITGVQQLKLVEKFVDKVCEYGDKHLPFPEKP